MRELGLLHQRGFLLKLTVESLSRCQAGGVCTTLSVCGYGFQCVLVLNRLRQETLVKIVDVLA